MTVPAGEFDGFRLHSALDARREQEGLTWAAVARQVWNLSATLDAQRTEDHPFSVSAISTLRERGNTSCQHGLLLVWWLGQVPEAFIEAPVATIEETPLPACDDAHRLRWSLTRLYSTLNTARLERGATWPQTAARLACTPSQLTGLRTARYSTSMRVAMKVTQALRRPAASFVYPADW